MRDIDTIAPTERHYEFCAVGFDAAGTLRALMQTSDEDLSVGRAFIYQFDSFSPDGAKVVAGMDDFALGFWVAQDQQMFVHEALQAVHRQRAPRQPIERIGLDTPMWKLWGGDDVGLYTCGDRGLVLSLEGEVFETKHQMAQKRRLRAVHGRGSTVAVAGDGGSIAVCVGGEWADRSLAAKVDLEAVHVGTDGSVRVAAEGYAARWHDDQWHELHMPLDDDGDPLGLCAITEFGGRVLWGGYGVYAESGDALEPFGGEFGATAMASHGDQLVVACANKLQRYDGSTWATLEAMPDPKNPRLGCRLASI